MIEEMQTPFFLIDEKSLSNNVMAFMSALEEMWRNSQIAYSVKTNALPWILKWMNRNNVFAEVVSDEEYKLALLSGFLPNHIVFNGPIKGVSAFRMAVENGSIVNIDSERELIEIEKMRPASLNNVGIRVNMDPSLFDKSDIGFEDGFRFGFCEENGAFLRAIDIMKKKSIDNSFGLHMHVNSVTRSVNIYRQIAKYAAYLISKYNFTPSFIDVGGGFFGGVPGKATPRDYLSVIKNELEKVVNPEKTKLFIEPGSAIIGSAVELYSSVLDVKDTTKARIVTTDGSRIYIDPLWLKKSYSFSCNSEKDLYPRQVICGYTCMDHDRLMVIENMPELSVGDIIVYHRVGNYTVTLGGPFIKPFPPVYAKIDGDIVLIRKELSVEDYYEMETD